MRRLNITSDVLARWNELTAKSTGLAAAKTMLGEFPDVWNRGTRPMSVYRYMLQFVRSENEPVDIPEPHGDFPAQMPEVQIEFRDRLGVVSDLHAPLHSPRLIELAAMVFRARGVETIVWNGDTFDNAHRGHKGIRNTRAAPFGVGLHAVGAIMDVFTEAGVRDHVIIPGNHDDKIWRDTDQEFGFEDLIKGKLWPILTDKSCQLTVSSRYYVVMRPRETRARWPFTSDNYPWRFTHQKNYRGKQLSTADALCGIYMSHIVTGHQHHLAIGQHGSGVLWACDAGTFQDPDLVEYKQSRDSAHVAWHPGFLTIEHGVPRMWSAKAPDEWWHEQIEQ